MSTRESVAQRERGAKGLDHLIGQAVRLDRTIVAEQKIELPAPAVDSMWPPPEALPELPEVPAFNFDVLPGPLRGFVHDIAERMQCPPEFPAVGAVVMVGAAIGRRLAIRPKRFDPWTVVPNVWGMIVGNPGYKKSPALSEAIAPLKRMEAKAFGVYESAKADYEISLKAEKIRDAHASEIARKALREDRSANLAAILRPEAQIEEPKPRRYIINDSTPEALCETLKDNPHGVMVERDELIGLLKSMDKEDRQEARALYLTAADGDKPFTVDRISREGGRIEGVCVSLLGGIQPGVLASYVRDTQRGGAGDDGLLQRFGLMVYPDVSRTWRNVDRPQDKESRDGVHVLIERLCNVTAAQAGAELGSYSEIPFVRFDAKAQTLFIEWQEDLETNRIRGGDDHPAIISHLAKYPRLVSGLALINHLSEGGRGPVSEAALGRALLFIVLLEAHARRVYSYAARPDLAAAKTVLAKLKVGKLPIEFTARHVYRAGWSGLATTEEAGAALRMLTDYGYLRERIADTGGRSSTVYRAHPSTKGKA